MADFTRQDEPAADDGISDEGLPADEVQQEESGLAEDGDSERSAEDQPTEPPPSPLLAKLALVLPVAAGISEPFLPDMVGLAVVIGTVLLTAVLLSIDIGRVVRWNPFGEHFVSPTRTLLVVILIWIVGFPLAYFRRFSICGPDMRGTALGATAAFVFLPWLITTSLKPPELPGCDAKEVAELIQRLAVNEFPGQFVEGVAGLREVEADPNLQWRRGSCVVSVGDQRIPVPYVIEWSDQKRGIFSVALILLPQANAPAVIDLVEPQVRSQLSEFRITGIDTFSEVSFDEEKQERRCSCVVHTDSADIRVPFVVSWHDKFRNQFIVQSFVLPSPISDEIAKVLEPFLDEAFADVEITAIDGYREVRANWKADERIGACTVHLGDENVEVYFRISWGDQYAGGYSLELIEENSI